MAIYASICVFVAALMFYVNITFFGKYRILRKDSIFIISIASIVIAVSFPRILNGFFRVGDSLSFSFILVTSIITCLVLMIIFSLIVDYMEYIRKNSDIICEWDKSIFISGLQKIICLKKILHVENSGILRGREYELSIEGKNIVEKSVDTEKNIDTMKRETFNSESLFYDNNFAIQKYNKAGESSPYNMDSPSVSSCNCEYDVTGNLENNSFVNDYETCLDYFNEEVLNEILFFENEYGSEVNKTIEKVEEDFIDSINSQKDCISFAQEFEDEYLYNTVDIDEIISEAFNFKEKGDYEGAILNFLCALNSQPSDDVVFWIVLDICSMYKQLGQAELAKEVLESYINQYGNFMDEVVMCEMRRCL